MSRVGWLALLVGCGGRSGLEARPGELEGFNRSGGGGVSGGHGGASFGGNVGPDGGTFGTITAGTSFGGVAFGGMPIAGMSMGGVATAGMAGAGNDQCRLATTDCYTMAESECAGVRAKCQGDVLSHTLVWATNRAQVNDIATAVDGRVAVVGSFLGLLNVNDATLPAVSSDYDGFALVFDAQQNLLFSQFFSGDGEQALTGVDFAPGGDLVVQGADVAAGGAFVTRLDEKGQTVWSNPLTGTNVQPGQVGIDNDGNITLVGAFQDELVYGGNTDRANGSASYVVHLDAKGLMLWERTGTPETWTSAGASRLVVDDEDNLIVVGQGVRANNTEASYVEKRSSLGTPLFLREIEASTSALAVDRKMQIVASGLFDGVLQLGAFSKTAQGGIAPDTWLAEMDRDGNWQWLDSLAGLADGSTAHPSALTTDPAGNIVLGHGAYGVISVMKRRGMGADVWTESFKTFEAKAVRLASDNAGNIWVACNFTDSFDYSGDLVTPQGDEAVMLLKLSP